MNEQTPSFPGFEIVKPFTFPGQPYSGHLLKIEVLDRVVMGNPNHTSLRELGFIF